MMVNGMTPRAFTTILTAAAALVCAASVQAAPAVQAGCLDMTAGGSISPHKILATVEGLTRDQKREFESRFLGAHGGAVSLAGLGLTLAQTNAIRQSIIAHTPVAHPPGWPCKPFVNQAKVAEFVRDTLIYNGFRPSVTVYVISPMQLGIRGVLDGRAVTGTVAKTGPSQITIRSIVEPDFGGSWPAGPGGTFDVGFSA